MLLLHDTMLNCSHDKDASRVLISNEIALWHNALFVSWNKGPTQVKYRLLISSIFDAMNFRHFLELLEIILQHFRKVLDIQCIKNARN